MSQPLLAAGCVLDASVGIKQFIREPLSDLAEAVFQDVPAGALYVPDLFYVECANILWKYVRRLNLPADEAARHIADLGALHLRVTPTQQLIDPALALALAYNITAYDACYAALALQLSLPLITADVRLSRLPAESGVTVIRLEDYPPPIGTTRP